MPNDDPSLYALLLYETDGFKVAGGAELLALYDEYSAWVAQAMRRGQFVADRLSTSKVAAHFTADEHPAAPPPSVLPPARR